MTTQEKIKSLESQLDSLYNEFPNSFFQQQQRDKSAFLISRELEKLKNPSGYAKNKNHWDGHELRF
jgi:hypothetical protein